MLLAVIPFLESRLGPYRAAATVALALLALAATAAVTWLAVRAQRLSGALARHADEEAALRTMARELSATTGLEASARLIVDSAVASTRATGAYVELIEDGHGHVTVLATHGEGPPPTGTSVPYPGSLTEAIVASAEPTLLAEAGALGASMARHLGAGCSRCPALAVPLFADREPIGALVLLRRPGGPAFAPDDARHIQVLGDIAAAALRRVRLAEALERENERVRASEAQFRAVVENTESAVFVIDEDDTIVFANAAVTRIFGYEVKELVGGSLLTLMAPEMRPRHRSGVERYLRTGRRNIRWEGTVLPARHRDGHEVPIEISMGEFTRAGRRYFAGIARDVGDRLRREKERAGALASAHAAMATRDQVLAIVAHDLRNPLNTIQLALHVPAGSPEEEARKSAVLRRNVQRMNRLIQDLLDVSRMEAGQPLTIKRTPVQPREVGEEVCATFRLEAEKKDVRLGCESTAGLPSVLADRDRLLQALGNLVANAVKFTPESGRVTIHVEERDERVRWAVADSGPGIPEEEQARVFEPFWQASRTRRLGTGLGLAIAKGIAEAHGGEIGLESRPGEGSTFWMAVPVAQDAGGGLVAAGGSPAEDQESA